MSTLGIILHFQRARRARALQLRPRHMRDPQEASLGTNSPKIGTGAMGAVSKKRLAKPGCDGLAFGDTVGDRI